MRSKGAARSGSAASSTPHTGRCWLPNFQGRKIMNSKPSKIPGQDHPITITPTKGRVTAASRATTGRAPGSPQTCAALPAVFSPSTGMYFKTSRRRLNPRAACRCSGSISLRSPKTAPQMLGPGSAIGSLPRARLAPELLLSVDAENDTVVSVCFCAMRFEL